MVSSWANAGHAQSVVVRRPKLTKRNWRGKCASVENEFAPIRRDVNLVIVSAPVQQLFERLRTGDSSALNELTPALYGELHRIASRHLRGERPNHTLQA